MSEMVKDNAENILTFNWKESGRRPFWLLFFILLSCVGHLVCFYLFRVVYPPQKRELVSAATVTILDSSDLLTSQVLAKINDRILALDGSDNMEALSALTDTGIRFRPFFEGYQPPLRELPRFETDVKASFFPAGGLFLPPINSRAGKLPPQTSEVLFKPVVSIDWEDRERKVLREFEWMPTVEVQRPLDSDECLFYVGVDRFGQVIHALPEQSAGGLMDSELLIALRKMRFASAEYSMIDWAWISFRW